MRHIKKRMIIAIVLTLLFIGKIDSANALENDIKLINNNNIKITEKQYDNLINLGFTDSEIYNMNINEFNNNKNLIGKIVSQKTDLIFNNNNKEFLFPLSDGQITTPYKKMTTSIISVSDRYRYKVSLDWLKIPSTRSYDIIGIGIESNVKIYGNAYNFQQNICYSANNCTSSMVNTPNISTTGIGVSFKLPSSTVSSLSSYMYFDVKKNTSSTIHTLNAYGDYSHATSSISSDNSTKFTIGTYGIALNNSIANYYDSISVAKATWTGSW